MTHVSEPFFRGNKGHSECTADLSLVRVRKVWRDTAVKNPQESNDKLATYQ